VSYEPKDPTAATVTANREAVARYDMASCLVRSGEGSADDVPARSEDLLMDGFGHSA
jgi:hypothetical protein